MFTFGAALSLGACGLELSDTDEEDDLCILMCGCSGTDVTGVCTGMIYASLSCGFGEEECDIITDKYGTVTQFRCEYANGEHYGCSSERDQIGRITDIECGSEHGQCFWP